MCYFSKNVIYEFIRTEFYKTHEKLFFSPQKKHRKLLTQVYLFSSYYYPFQNIYIPTHIFLCGIYTSYNVLIDYTNKEHVKIKKSGLNFGRIFLSVL